MIFDAHAHVGKGVARTENSQFDVMAEWLINQMDKSGIEKAIVFPVYHPIFKSGNDEVAEAVRRYPNRFIGFAGVQMNCLKHGLEDLKYGLDVLGLKGVGELKPMNLSPNVLLPILSAIEERGVPANFHTSVRLADYIARKFPKLIVILAHMGWNDPQSIAVAKERPNLYLDTSTASLDLIIQAVEKIGAEKIIFGSDAPFIYPYPELRKIEVLPIADGEKRLILYENITRILEGGG